MSQDKYCRLYTAPDKTLEILKILVADYGVPTLNLRFNIFCQTNSTEWIEIEFLFNRCKLILRNDRNEKLMQVEIHSIQDLLILLRKFEIREYNIGRILIEHNFGDDNVRFVSGTFKGDQLNIPSSLKKNFSKYTTKVSDIYVTTPVSNLVENSGKLNDELFRFCEVVGFPLTRNVQLVTKVSEKSNDYTFYENPYYQITGTRLIGQESLKTTIVGSDGITIIIPVYGGFESLKKTVLSIQNQSFVQIANQKIQVVIVNDGSESILTSSMFGKNNIDIEVVNIEKNLGRAHARNAGVSIAKFNKFIFIDSDVVIPPNYVYEMYIRLCLIPNAVLIAFKECLNPNSPELDDQNIKNGMRMPINFECDWRVNCYIDDTKQGLRKTHESQFRNILLETNGLKSFGFNRFIGVFDLAATVATHNVAMNKEVYMSTDGFDTDFAGWGLEDTHFGYKLIASGATVIPVMSTGIFHIDHPPRSGSEQEKWNEFTKNLEILKNKLNG